MKRFYKQVEQAQKSNEKAARLAAINATEMNKTANLSQMSFKFKQYTEEQAKSAMGKHYRVSPRVGAGSLGPNYK